MEELKIKIDNINEKLTINTDIINQDQLIEIFNAQLTSLIESEKELKKENEELKKKYSTLISKFDKVKDKIEVEDLLKVVFDNEASKDLQHTLKEEIEKLENRLRIEKLSYDYEKESRENLKRDFTKVLKIIKDLLIKHCSCSIDIETFLGKPRGIKVDNYKKFKKDENYIKELVYFINRYLED